MQNAQPSSIGADFGRFGLKFWDAVDLHHQRSKQRRKSLDELNQWRNAIAHQDFSGVGAGTLHLQKSGIGAQSARGLAKSFDAVIRDHLVGVVGKAPW